MNAENTSVKIEPALLTILQVCQLLNISRAEFYRLDSTGKFAPLPVGLCKKRLYLKSEILAWLAEKCPHRKIWQAQKKKGILKKLLKIIGAVIGFLATLFTCLDYLLRWLGPVKAFITKILWPK